MGFNPLKEKGLNLENQFRSWNDLAKAPYDTRAVHPYTRCRVIVMNGAEFEANWFTHQMARHVRDDEVRRQLARLRRSEQQQQKAVGALVPGAETTLEHTIGYEQVAVDITAWLARNEPDSNVKKALDFGLLEDFDHLYRYANIMDMESKRQAADIVGELTEVTPGRPTIAQHRHPFDAIRTPVNAKQADIQTLLHILTIVAAEQQTMNFYMNVANRAENSTLRKLYTEIGMIEEQHVSHYESLMDANSTWFEQLVLHEYNECYLYHSFMQDETDPKIRRLWEQHLEMEISHLHAACDIMRKHDNREPEEMLPEAMPEPLKFESNIAYVRKVIGNQVTLTTNGTGYTDVDDLPKDHRYFQYNKHVNDGPTPSQVVIEEHIRRHGRDYRMEQGEHPHERFRNRKSVPPVK